MFRIETSRDFNGDRTGWREMLRSDDRAWVDRMFNHLSHVSTIRAVRLIDETTGEPVRFMAQGYGTYDER